MPLGHAVYCPADSNLILYDNHALWCLVHRTWLINADGTGNRKVFSSSIGESLGHEFWSADGRSIYSPIDKGVFWDEQDIPLEEIERIEVIRGPGATMWGANAVNGVVNIITRKAKDTQGLLATTEAGSGQLGAELAADGSVTRRRRALASRREWRRSAPLRPLRNTRGR